MLRYGRDGRIDREPATCMALGLERTCRTCVAVVRKVRQDKIVERNLVARIGNGIGISNIGGSRYCMGVRPLSRPSQGCGLDLRPGKIALLKNMVFYIVLERVLPKISMNGFIGVAKPDGWEKITIFTNIFKCCP